VATLSNAPFLRSFDTPKPNFRAEAFIFLSVTPVRPDLLNRATASFLQFLTPPFPLYPSLSDISAALSLLKGSGLGTGLPPTPLR